jgi:hypothetical protein
LRKRLAGHGPAIFFGFHIAVVAKKGVDARHKCGHDLRGFLRFNACQAVMAGLFRPSMILL